MKMAKYQLFLAAVHNNSTLMAKLTLIEEVEIKTDPPKDWSVCGANQQPGTNPFTFCG